MPKIHQASKCIEVEMVGENIIIFYFKSITDRKRALCEGPWNFFKDVVIFKEPLGSLKPSEIVFEDVSIWVQFHNLPLAFMHPEVLRNIGGNIGTVIEVDTDDVGRCLVRFARICINRNIQQPLPKGLWISPEDGGKKNCILLLYERLPNFCFACGRIGHIVRDCADSSANKEILGFESWIKAPFIANGRKSGVPRAHEGVERSSSSSQATYKPVAASNGILIPIESIGVSN